jgi:GNAT superfamily N-acetyltransferase
MLTFNRIGAIQRFIRQEGVVSALLRAMTGLTGLVYRRESVYILARPVDRASIAPTRLDGIKIDILRQDQVDRLTPVIYYGRDEVLQRLNDGQKCIVAEHEGGIVHYSWLTAKGEYAGEIEKVIPVAAGERYLFNCRTLASARGRGIFPAVIARALDEAGDSGASRMIALVSTNNRSSLKAFAKMAFSIREEITMTRFLVFRGYRTSSVKHHD